MGGGFPAAAFGGRADIMARLAPEGPVYQAGTLSGNPVATAAGLATLRHCTDEVYAHLDVVAREIADAASAALSAESVPHRVQWAGSMFSIFFREGEVRNYADAGDQDTAAFGRFFHAMLEQCVHLPPSAFELNVRRTMDDHLFPGGPTGPVLEIVSKSFILSFK